MRAAIIGGGPAGLMAADTLLREGIGVDIHDAMPSFGRKFLMAGKSGLNISNAEDEADFLARYPNADPRLLASVKAFGAHEITAFMAHHGIKTHTGKTGRIFPDMMKASPLLRAWLNDLQARGAILHTKSVWRGFDPHGNPRLTPIEPQLSLRPTTAEPQLNTVRTPCILALGGASWKRLGSSGAWTKPLNDSGIETAPFLPSNCGFTFDWSSHITDRFEGKAVKSVGLSSGGQTSRGEFVITRTGVESGGIYALSAALREQLTTNDKALIVLDLLPDTPLQTLTQNLAKPRGKQSLSNHLRKAARLNPVKLALLRELAPKATFDTPESLATIIKALPLPLTGMAPLDEAISTTGGLPWTTLDDDYMLKALPGVFCAGEMIDWDAPTGGYLLTACFATGRSAGLGLAKWLKAQR